MAIFLPFFFAGFVLAQETPTRPPMPRPTEDRLSAPPTAPSPTQADEGEQLYWLHCQPCHGDVGQGLTDEWRAEYPEDHQNCWKSGCHGDRPYENGFTLPDTVPAIIGGDSLARFETLGQLYAYTRSVMPFEYPGVLSDEEYLAVTAFLAQENDIWDGVPLTETNVNRVRLRPLRETEAEIAQATFTPTAELESMSQPGIEPGTLFVGGVIVLVLVAGGAWLWRRHRQ